MDDKYFVFFMSVDTQELGRLIAAQNRANASIISINGSHDDFELKIECDESRDAQKLLGAAGFTKAQVEAYISSGYYE